MNRKILVPIKRVIDAYVNIRVKTDHSGVETERVKMSINPFDEIALEEALRLKENNRTDEVIVVSIGERACQETLRQGLALGADRAIHIVCDQELEPLLIAKVLQAIVEQEQPPLVIMGKQAIDDDSNQTGQMLAGLLNWSQGTFASKIELQSDRVIVTREVDNGLEVLALCLPSVITVDLRLNTPRYASLPNIMQAKRKPLTEIPIDSFNIDLTARQQIVEVTPPPERKVGVRIENAMELVAKLRNEAKVI